MRIVSVSPLFNSDFKAGNTLHHYYTEQTKMRFTICDYDYCLPFSVCSYNGYFYTLYDSTEISQVDTRNAGEYGKEAEKANEAGMILFNISI